MDALSVTGRPPPLFSSNSASPRAERWRRHVVIPRRFGRLVFDNSKLTLSKIVIRNSNPDVSTFLDPEPDNHSDYVTANIIADVSTESADTENESDSTKEQDELQASTVTLTDGSVYALRKPGVFYKVERKSVPKVEPKPDPFFVKLKSVREDSGSVTLLKKPDIMGTELVDESELEGPVEIRYESSKSLKEFYKKISCPAQLPLLNKPDVKTSEPELNQGFLSSEERESELDDDVTKFRSKSSESVNSEYYMKISCPVQVPLLKKPEVFAPKPITNQGIEGTGVTAQNSDNDKPGLDSDTESKPNPSMFEDLSSVTSVTLNQKPDLVNPSYSTTNSIESDDLGEETMDRDQTDPDPKPKPNPLLVKERYMQSSKDLSNITLLKKPESGLSVGLQQTGGDGVGEFDDSTPRRMDSADASLEQEEWRKVEELRVTGERVVVELTGYNPKGFFASLESIVGFIPHRNLGTRWKFLAFESWLRKKGVDPTLYSQNVKTRVEKQDLDLNEKENGREEKEKEDEILSSKSVFEDLVRAYGQEKSLFLSSFIGQKMNVRVVMADKSSKRVMFSAKRQEKEESDEKKRGLMVKLKVGDIVKCRIEKFAYFGIFVEVEGVLALIPQSEVLFDGTLDLLSSLKIGQIVDARVHQLDYTLERITLSLQGITSDPPKEDFESVVGGGAPLGGTFVPAESDEEWPDVESLIKELEKIKGIISVSKGNFFLSSGLAPTFQVYMAPMVEDTHRLLARFGNRVQEVIVNSSLDKEQIKNAILTCASRVT